VYDFPLRAFRYRVSLSPSPRQAVFAHAIIHRCPFLPLFLFCAPEVRTFLECCFFSCSPLPVFLPNDWSPQPNTGKIPFSRFAENDSWFAVLSRGRDPLPSLSSTRPFFFKPQFSIDESSPIPQVFCFSFTSFSSSPSLQPPRIGRKPWCHVHALTGRFPSSPIIIHLHPSADFLLPFFLPYLSPRHFFFSSHLALTKRRHFFPGIARPCSTPTISPFPVKCIVVSPQKCASSHTHSRRCPTPLLHLLNLLSGYSYTSSLFPLQNPSNCYHDPKEERPLFNRPVPLLKALDQHGSLPFSQSQPLALLVINHYPVISMGAPGPGCFSPFFLVVVLSSRSHPGRFFYDGINRRIPLARRGQFCPLAGRHACHFLLGFDVCPSSLFDFFSPQEGILSLFSFSTAVYPFHQYVRQLFFFWQRPLAPLFIFRVVLMRREVLFPCHFMNLPTQSCHFSHGDYCNSGEKFPPFRSGYFFLYRAPRGRDSPC